MGDLGETSGDGDAKIMELYFKIEVLKSKHFGVSIVFGRMRRKKEDLESVEPRNTKPLSTLI